MIPLLKVALELQNFFEDRDWRFCFIGGLAVQRWGEPRLTVDIDCTLFTGLFEEQSYIDETLKSYSARYENAVEFALKRRVLLLIRNEIGIDISLGAISFEESAIERSSIHEFTSEIGLRTCSAEDLIVFKAFADREKDWLDVRGVVTRQTSLDWNYILEQLTPLVELKETFSIISDLETIRKNLYRP